jgi:hypothetical protein
MLLQRSTGYGSDKNRQQMAKKLIKDIDNNLKYKKNLYGDEILYNGGVLAKLLEFDLKMDSKKNRNKKKI